MTASIDIALATAVDLSEPDLDLEPLSDALESAGLRCSILAWDDSGADFGSAAMTLLRSTWNYPLRPGDFLDWIDETARSSDLWNPAAVVRWNMHKRYLLELAKVGIPVTPTELARRGSKRSLVEIARTRCWDSVVVKPAVSASSMNTLVFSSEELDRGEAHLEKLAIQGDALVQQYLPSVEDYGERALVWIDGELTHAVRKSPRFLGDAESTSAEAVPISAAEKLVAGRALEAAARSVDCPLLYARVDLAPGPDGNPLVMELELIEPSLYLSRSEEALDRMVEAIRFRRAGLPETG